MRGAGCAGGGGGGVGVDKERTSDRGVGAALLHTHTSLDSPRISGSCPAAAAISIPRSLPVGGGAIILAMNAASAAAEDEEAEEEAEAEGGRTGRAVRAAGNRKESRPWPFFLLVSRRSFGMLPGMISLVPGRNCGRSPNIWSRPAAQIKALSLLVPQLTIRRGDTVWARDQFSVGRGLVH